MSYFALLAIAGLLYLLFNDPLGFRYLDTSNLYVRVEDQGKGELYARRTRVVEYAIVFEVEEFKRITCAKGVAYLGAQSDWFKNVAYRDGTPLATYVRLPQKQAKVLLKEQMPITFAVHKRIAQLKKKGQFKKDSGVFA